MPLHRRRLAHAATYYTTGACDVMLMTSCTDWEELILVPRDAFLRWYM
jgi:hypothetical protein